MTTETLRAHIKDYRAGSITVRDHKDMVDELVKRMECVEMVRDDLELRFNSMRDAFIAQVFDD